MQLGVDSRNNHMADSMMDIFLEYILICFGHRAAYNYVCYTLIKCLIIVLFAAVSDVFDGTRRDTS